MAGCQSQRRVGSRTPPLVEEVGHQGPHQSGSGATLEGNITEHIIGECPTFESDRMTKKLYSPTSSGEEGRTQPGKYG